MIDSTPAAVDAILSKTTDPPPTYDFAFNNYLKREFRFGVGAGRPVCKPFVQGHCPQGNNCPDKHPAQTGFNR
jgi:cleavage and polyadenylation specificity factor subunit 4